MQNLSMYRHFASASHALFRSVPTASPLSQYSLLPHFMEEETEAYRYATGSQG